jgi:CRP-like cAMP-binding protein
MTRQDHKLSALSNLPLFAKCGHHELVDLARLLEISWVSAGQVLETEGVRSRWWKIVAAGSASVTQGGRPSGLLSAGDWWGERSISLGEPSSVTIIALTPVTLLSLQRRFFLSLPSRHPLVAGRIISRLAGRPAPYESLVVA